MTEGTSQFYRVETDSNGESRIVNEIPVRVTVDGESIVFTPPSGPTRRCNRRAWLAGRVGEDAGRSSVRISLDRAKALADRAAEAGLARWNAQRDDALEMGTALKDKLAEMGARNLMGLNLDQAGAIEGFIASGATT